MDGVRINCCGVRVGIRGVTSWRVRGWGRVAAVMAMVMTVFIGSHGCATMRVMIREGGYSCGRLGLELETLRINIIAKRCFYIGSATHSKTIL